MIKLGMVGIGEIATSYIRLIANQDIKQVELVALCSRNRLNMERVVNDLQLTGIQLFQDYEEMLQTGGIEAVIICTPHFQHPKMAIKALEYNIHTLIEKPVGVYPDEIKVLKKVSEDKPHLKCGVLYNRRCGTAYQKVKEIMDHDGIGSLKRVNWMITNLYRTDAYFKSSAWRGTYKGEGGGLLMTQASHQLDLLQWLCGMPHTVHGFCYNGINREIEVENDVTLLMEFENHATGQFIASSVECPGSNRLEIIGDKGQLILTNDEHLVYHKLTMSESVFNQTNGELFGQIPYETETFDFGVEDNKIQQAELINQFIQAIRRDEEVICPLSQAIQSLTLIQACYLSSWSKQAVSLPLDTDSFMKQLKERM